MVVYTVTVLFQIRPFQLLLEQPFSEPFQRLQQEDIIFSPQNIMHSSFNNLYPEREWWYKLSLLTSYNIQEYKSNCFADCVTVSVDNYSIQYKEESFCFHEVLTGNYRKNCY